jgi:hypothetical protein
MAHLLPRAPLGHMWTRARRKRPSVEGRRLPTLLVRCLFPAHLCVMFVVTEADAAAIRAIFEKDGELSAAIEVRRRFPGVADNVEARACARTIAGWKPPE